MNQITKITAVDPIAAFVEEAARRLHDLGYDADLIQFECRAWTSSSGARWRFRPTIWNTKPALRDIEAPTQAECLALAKAWLSNLKSEKDTLAAVLGIAAE